MGLKKKKKPETGLGWVRVLVIPGLNPTHIHRILKKI